MMVLPVFDHVNINYRHQKLIHSYIKSFKGKMKVKPKREKSQILPA